MTNGTRDLRRLAATTAAAEDARLLRLVQMLDRLPSRGEADHVLDLVRPRLRLLRPRRPLRLARLLFTPLDPSIVPPAQWRRGTHCVPRSALAPLARAVQAAMAAEERWTGFAETLERHSTEEEEAVLGLGGRLWPFAAEALPAAPPPGWAEAGLQPEDYGAIRTLLVPVLASGEAICAAQCAGAEGPPRPVIRAALVGPAAAGPLPLAAALAAVLARAAAPAEVLATCAEFGAAARATAGRVLDSMLEHGPALSATALRAAAAEATHFFGWTEVLARSGSLDPERARRVQVLQREASEACRARIAESGAAELVQPLLALAAGGGDIPDQALAAIEEEARNLRLLANATRRGGDPSIVEPAMRGLADRILALPARAGLSQVELARVVEILVGPEAALQVLGAAAAGGGGAEAPGPQPL